MYAYLRHLLVAHDTLVTALMKIRRILAEDKAYLRPGLGEDNAYLARRKLRRRPQMDMKIVCGIPARPPLSHLPLARPTRGRAGLSCTEVP